jgi:formylglycine-generating enzyme required for sulfatase activity
MRLPSIILAVLCSLAGTALLANNIQVANSTLTGNTGTSVQIQFDLSWENSWRGGGVTNWDAAWVFVKYRTANGVWRHSNLNNTGHVPAIGSQINLGLLMPGSAYSATTNPVLGVFIYRDAPGTGNLSLAGIQLQWNFAAQGVNYSDIAQVQVFAIEMVYVPQGAFAAGSGGAEVNAFTLTTINTANATTAPSGLGVVQAGGYPTGQTAPANASWPNGFNAFYCMKYEMSQQQYVDFLNTLTRTQQNTRTGTDISGTAITNRYVMSNTSTSSNRNGIRCDGTLPASPSPVTFYCDLNNNGIGGEATDGREIACNWLSWGDLTAYLDWSGLRPMTELEFEKACRGTIAPVANEYPWGTTGVAGSAYTLANSGANNEGIASNYSTTLGNAVSSGTNGTPSGPKRVGIFAANGANSGRVSAGASYYGIMELGGNLEERAVDMVSATGRLFTGLHGNGALNDTGSADESVWYPSDASNSRLRGGSWGMGSTNMRVSDRNGSAFSPSERNIIFGGRGVRLFP